jgi:ankyrin repeat protein
MIQSSFDLNEKLRNAKSVWRFKKTERFHKLNALTTEHQHHTSRSLSMRTYLAFCLTLTLILRAIAGIAQEQHEKPESKLIEAAEKGDLREVKELIRQKVDLNAKNEEEGSTALMKAATHGHLEIVQELLRAGADVNIADDLNGATVLMLASSGEEEEMHVNVPMPQKIAIVKALLQAHAKVNQQNFWGGTALQWAVDAATFPIVNLLIASGADVNLGDRDGLTPLMAAANYDEPGYLETIQALLKAGAKIDAKNTKGDTALMYAMNNFKTQNTKALMAAHADVNSHNNAGITPLMKASQLARVDIMKVLIAAGADVNAHATDGKSVLAVAKGAGYKDAIQLLRESGAKEE